MIKCVKIRDNLWLSAPEDRITLGRLTSHNIPTSQTDTYVCTKMREKSGSKTMDWVSWGGRDVIYISNTELYLVESILETCREIIVNAF